MTMTIEELKRAAKIARDAAAAAGVELRQHYGHASLLHKNGGDASSGVVTELDRRTEQFLQQELSTFLPGVGFRGEEFGTQSDADITWLVDPIDGTVHFSRGMPFCTTMIALIERGQVVMSVIYDFVNDDMYWAVKGGGSFCNEAPISVSTRGLHESLLSFETRLEELELNAKYLAVRQRAVFFSATCSGFEFAMIASGKLDGRIAIHPYGMDWDFAPGSLLVTEAGGIATNIGLSSYSYTNHDYVIANAVVHQELTAGVDAIFPLSNSLL